MYEGRVQSVDQIVFTNKARCRDCNRCVRVCPVKAIRMENGQAYVVEELCIGCGTCVRECPQGAKTYRRDVDRVKNLIKSGAKVAVSVSPTFGAILEKWQTGRLPSVLRELGFSFISETATGAYHAAQQAASEIEAEGERSHICSACPSVINYLEKYRNPAAALLTKTPSPMILHALHIKRKLGNDTEVVFIGPCIAKKHEAEREEYRGIISHVITFEELFEWMGDSGVDFMSTEESSFDEMPGKNARLFPLEGGMLKTAALHSGRFSTEISSVSGFDYIKDSVDSMGSLDEPVIIEPLFCLQGCINGPATGKNLHIFEKRRRLISSMKEMPYDEAPQEEERTPVLLHVREAGLEEPIYSENRIRSILSKTGKHARHDELNCGACGYTTCREKAVAVLKGLAECEMCVPYMRRMAERKIDKLIKYDPNGVVILDGQLHILDMNPAFKEMFVCSDAVNGKHISYLMDPDPFEQQLLGKCDLFNQVMSYPNYSLICNLMVFPIPEEEQFVGIFNDITDSIKKDEKFDTLRVETLDQAMELLEHQRRMAQDMARFLGESTARGEALLKKLMTLVGDKGNGKKENWLWDTYMSK